MEDNLDKFTENTALFDAYIRGEMPPGQRAEFEARLAADASLRNDFDLHRALLGSMDRNWERERLREQVKEAREAMLNQGKNAGGGQQEKRFLLPLAALILLLLVGGSVWYFWPEPEPQDKKKKEQPDNTRPQALNEQPGDETLSGANKEFAYEITSQVVRITKGQRHEKTGTAYKIQLHETPENKAVAIFEDAGIRLFFPVGQSPDKSQLRLIELDLEGNTSLYLQNGTQYFEIRKIEGKQELKPVNDPAIPDWLK